MRRLYHITSKWNLDSILELGLVPQYGMFSEMNLEQYSAVYLFADMEEALYARKNWMGYFRPEEDMVLLQVDLPDSHRLEERFGWERISYSAIPPECITQIEFPDEKKAVV